METLRSERVKFASRMGVMLRWLLWWRVLCLQVVSKWRKWKNVPSSLESSLQEDHEYVPSHGLPCTSPISLAYVPVGARHHQHIPTSTM